MMKHLLTIVLCLTTLTGLAQEEKIKKSEWWNGNPSYAVPIREVNVTARRPMKEIGIQKTQLDTTILHENIALSMADTPSCILRTEFAATWFEFKSLAVFEVA